MKDTHFTTGSKDCELCGKEIIFTKDNNFRNIAKLGIGKVSITCNHCNGLFLTDLSLINLTREMLIKK